MEFDFDAWAKLAKDDPAAFEHRRERVLREAIDNAPAAFRARLQGLQCRLDLERSGSATPYASCVRLNSLMWAGFFRLRKELRSASAQPPRPPFDASHTAQIIPLRSGRAERPAAGEGCADS